MATTQRADDYYAWSPLKLVSAIIYYGQISMPQHLFARPRTHFGTQAEANPASMEALR